MNINQKIIGLMLVGTLSTSSLLAAPTLALASELPKQDVEVYMLEEESTPTATVLRERGRCTDSYSKEWCDAHGFQNNRPVPHKVKLTKKEADCYWSLVQAGVGGAIGTVTQGPGGALQAAAAVAWALWNCGL